MPSPSSVSGRSGKVAGESRMTTGQRRLSRNESEKMRRDKLNMHIAELAKLVPMVASAPRKLDKSSILRLSVNYLRMHYELKKAKAFEKWRPSFLTEENLGEMLLEAYDGFLLVVSHKGDILHVSDLITPLLGHSQVDLLGQSVYQLIHPDDISLCRDQFCLEPQTPNIEGALERPSQLSTFATVFPVSKNGRRSFHVRMLSLLNKDQKSYELVHLTCHVRTFHPAERQGCNTVIMGVGRLVSQEGIRELNLVAADAREFTTQHGLDGNILYADQRHALYNGRLTHEVYGKSPYVFIHADDLPVVHFSHQKIMVTGAIDSTVFRVYTKSGDIIFVEARSSICCDNWTKEPKFILSNNVLISEELFTALMAEQRAEMLQHQAGTDSGVVTDVSTSPEEEGPDSPPLDGCLSDRDSPGLLSTLNNTEKTDSSHPHPQAHSNSADLPTNWKTQATENSSGWMPPRRSNPPTPARLDSPSSDSPNKSVDSSAIAQSDSNRSATSKSTGCVVRDSVDKDPNDKDKAFRCSDATEVMKYSDAEVDRVDSDLFSATLTGVNKSKSSAVASSEKSKERSILHSLLYEDGEDDFTSSHGPGTNDNEGLPTAVSKPSYCTDAEFLYENRPPSRHSHILKHQSEMKMALVQSQLAQQLEGKYQQLDSSLQQQGAELSTLKDNLLRYLLSHPEAQQSYLQRLQRLECKRQQHERALENLKMLYHHHQEKLCSGVEDPFRSVEPDTTGSPLRNTSPQSMNWRGPSLSSNGSLVQDTGPPIPNNAAMQSVPVYQQRLHSDFKNHSTLPTGNQKPCAIEGMCMAPAHPIQQQLDQRMWSQQSVLDLTDQLDTLKGQTVSEGEYSADSSSGPQMKPWVTSHHIPTNSYMGTMDHIHKGWSTS